MQEQEPKVIRQTIFQVQKEKEYTIDVDETTNIKELKKILAHAAHLRKNSFKIYHNDIEFTQNFNDKTIYELFPKEQKIYFTLVISDFEEEEEEDCLIEFDVEDDKINSLINENKENIVLKEVLLYLFENAINSYFENCGNKIKEKKDNNNKFILKEPFKYFKICIEYLDNNENDNILNVLYYIAYVKCFLNKLIDLIYHNINELGDIREFNDYLKSKDNKFRKVIKLYILKIFYILYFKNIKDFIENDWDHHQIKYKSEFKFEENSCNLEYLFIDINKKDDFDNLLNKFKQIQEKGFREYTKDIKDEIINNNNLLIFYDICVYKMISNLINKNYLFDNNSVYINFCNFSQFIFRDLKQNTKKILNLYFNVKMYQQKVANYFKDNNKNENFEILLYSFKICLICSLSKNVTFYSNLLSEKFESTLKNNYLPGNDSYEKNTKIEGFQKLENFLKENKNTRFGAYVCSCGFAYFIEQCGLQNEEIICPICKKKIGGVKHKLIEKKKKYRVYKDKKKKKNIEKNKKINGN